MSDNETVKSPNDPVACVPETASSKQKDAAEDPARCVVENIATKENGNASIHGGDSEVSSPSHVEISETPTREVNTAIGETAKISSEIGEIEEKRVGDSAPCDNKQNEESPTGPETQQQTIIGAGDVCIATKGDENDVTKKPEDVISPISTIDQTAPTNDRSSTESDKNVPDKNDETTVSKLKEEVQKAIEERDSYRKKLENMEKKLAGLQLSYDTLLKGDGDEVMLRRMIEQLKGKLIHTSLQLEDRIRTVTNQEKQISALNSQVASLKEVESLTRSLLQIRNMEVKHLQAEVDDMEVRISEERERYNTMINKMDAAVKLNADLKKEYETQLRLFRDLREKYEEKVTLLSEEKRALEATAQSVEPK